MMLELLSAQTMHARHGALKNQFTYGVDYVLIDLGAEGRAPSRSLPLLFSRNGFNLWSLWDRHHGGPRGEGCGVDWFKETLAGRGFPVEKAQLLLLTQPSCLGFEFNPVSFWIALIDGAPCAFIAEVNSTFGQRHCYFCAHPDFRPIARQDQMEAEKLMHVSPFQKVAGRYKFNFGMTEDKIDIRIAYENGKEGVLATLNGPRKPATNRRLLWAALRRPMGALRVLSLIHWQAIILYLKRAPFLKKQSPPETLLSHGKPVEKAKT